MIARFHLSDTVFSQQVQCKSVINQVVFQAVRREKVAAGQDLEARALEGFVFVREVLGNK